MSNNQQFKIMHSTKIKSKQLATKNNESIAAIVVLPEKNKFRIYVAWENEPAALDGFMGFFKSSNLYDTITPEAIEETKKYGTDIGYRPDVKKIFKAIF